MKEKSFCLFRAKKGEIDPTNYKKIDEMFNSKFKKK